MKMDCFQIFEVAGAIISPLYLCSYMSERISIAERGLPLYACVDNDKAGARFISENNLIQCNKVLSYSVGVEVFNELLQKTVHTRELIDKSQSAQNLPTEPSKVKPLPHSHKVRQ